jgi:hypothetical protein
MENWICELTPEEGRLLLNLLEKNRREHGGRYDPDCLLCRAQSRISLGRDYGFDGLQAETKEHIRDVIRKEGKPCHT